MTWHAQEGDMTLHGREAQIFREAILEMCERIRSEEDDEHCVFGGVKVFDRMTRTQQLASLEKVAEYLFHDTDQCLELTAWSEATLASILQLIRSHVHLEIDYGQSDTLRGFLAQEMECETESDKWNDHNEWEWSLEGYESRFLWDVDFEDDTVADMPPESARIHREMFGIADEYFSAIPPDLESGDNIPSIIERISKSISGEN